MLPLPVSRLAHFALPPNQDVLAQPSARLEPVLGIENWRKGLREIEGALCRVSDQGECAITHSGRGPYARIRGLYPFKEFPLFALF